EGWLVHHGLSVARSVSVNNSNSVWVNNSNGVTTISVNGQTVVLKETEKEAVSKTFQTGPAPNVVVEVFNGNITVEAAPEGAVEVEVTKTVLGETREEAKANLEYIDVQMQQEGNAVRITACRLGESDQDTQTLEGLKKQHSIRSADALVKVPVGA